jgi:hypothetical protein
MCRRRRLEFAGIFFKNVFSFEKFGSRKETNHNIERFSKKINKKNSVNSVRVAKIFKKSSIHIYVAAAAVT